MDPRDFFRGFFGFPGHNFNPNFERDDPEGQDEGQGDDQDEVPFGEGRGRGSIDVFTSPLQMERFFNQQLESILAGLGINEGFFTFPSQPGRHHSIFEIPIPDGHDPDFEPDARVEAGSRDFMLKKGPGFLPPPRNNEPVRDEVMDRIDVDELDKLYADPKPVLPVDPRGQGFGVFGAPFFSPGHFHSEGPGENGPRISTFSFGQSVIQTRTVKPDGTVEERRTVRDNSGKETTTITRTIGSKTETTTTIRSPDGSTQIKDGKGHLDDETFDKKTFQLVPKIFGPNENPDYSEKGSTGIFSRFFDPFQSGKSWTHRDEMLKPIPEEQSPTYRSIFKKLFGE